MYLPDDAIEAPTLRTCVKCGLDKPETEEFFYVQRARGPHKTSGWQSGCRECWKTINAANKLRRKLAKK